MGDVPVLSIYLLQPKENRIPEEIMSKQRMGVLSHTTHPPLWYVWNPCSISVMNSIAQQNMTSVQS